MKRPNVLYRLLSLIAAISLVFSAFPAVEIEAASLNHNYPRLANYFLKPSLSEERINGLKKWDVLILNAEFGHRDSSGLNSIKAQNPNVVLLPYVDTMLVAERGSYGWDWRYNYAKLLAAEASGSPGWWLYDQYGNQISTWVDNLNLSLSDSSPTYNGVRWSDFLAKLAGDQIVRDYPWDGVFYDDAHQYASWLNGGNLDLNTDGAKDTSSYIDQHWGSGLNNLFAKTRQYAGPGALIIGNGEYTLYGYGNGRLFENFPRFWSGATWDSTMQEYFSWQSKGLSPQLQVLNGNNRNSGDQFSNIRNMRFTLTSALLGDGYFSYDYGSSSHGQLWWYDEYSVDASGNATGDDTGKGYLGRPKGAAQRLSSGTWRRDFDRGIVLVNPTSQTQTVNLEKTYKKIKGTQAPSVNDGSQVNTITLPGNDGIILLDPSPTSAPPTIINPPISNPPISNPPPAGDITDTEAPSSPSNVVARALSSSEIELSWAASSDDVRVAGYKIERSLDGVAFREVARTPNTAYIDSGLAPSTTYWYRIRAYDAAGNESTFPSDINDTKAPSPPSDIVAKALSSSEIKLSWTASSDNVGVAGYKVERSLDGINFSEIARTPNTAYIDSGLTPSTTYWYRIKAYDAAGNVSP